MREETNLEIYKAAVPAYHVAMERSGRLGREAASADMAAQKARIALEIARTNYELEIDS